MSLTSLAKLFGIFSLLVQLSVALPQASTCSCNGNISQKGSGECKTTHEEKPFCYVYQGQCPDEQESSQSGWFWSYRACGQGTRSTPQEPDLRSGASTCSCNGNISQKGSGECKTTHEGQPFCYVDQGQCADQQESSQSGWFWSKQACASASSCSCNGNINDNGGGECQGDDNGQPYCYVNQGQCPDQQESSKSGWFWSEQACVQGTKSTLQKPFILPRASTCSCNGNISQKGSGECKTNHEEKPFCYVSQGQCPDEQESSQSGWFWSKQACAPRTRSILEGPNLRSGASTCSCNGNISQKGSGECKTNHEEKPFCYVNQGQCPDQQESSQSGWFWSKQACAPGIGSSLRRSGSGGPVKYLTSPNYPKSYPNNQDTTQTMSVPAGSSILVKFLDFQIENHRKCRWDYVQICDGNGNGNCQKKICGSSLPGEITIGTSTATVKFHSDGSVTQKGFKLSYEPLTGPLKYLTSPKYPNAYLNNQDTSQTMSVPAGTSILVKFLDFQIENHRTCRWDYVQICDGNGKCQEKICGSSLPGEITIETSTATVKFHSDRSVTQRGFKLSYQPGSACPKEHGFCGVNGGDQNEGVVKLDSIDANTEKRKEDCLAKCLKYKGATGCEAIWSPEYPNRGCYVHTQEVDRAIGGGNHVCWLFSKCKAPSTKCQCGVKKNQNRIVGGQEAEKNEYPWQVALTLGGSFCGGSILTSKHILTAAHCTEGKTASSITAKVGEHDIRDPDDGQETLSVSSITDHPDYNFPNYDISILTLSKDVTFRDEVKPVCLPNPSSNYDDVTATVTGWGFLKAGAGSLPSKLNEVDVKTMSNSKCTDSSTVYSSRDITDVMICAASPGKDSCQGDSGGPLVAPENGGQYYSLIGVVSWGLICAQSDAPGVYARVTDQLDWIQDNIAGGRTCSPPV